MTIKEPSWTSIKKNATEYVGLSVLDGFLYISITILDSEYDRAEEARLGRKDVLELIEFLKGHYETPA